MTSLASFDVIANDPFEQHQKSLCSDFTFIEDVAIPVVANKYESDGKTQLSGDITSEELSIQLEELIDENNKLKEKLKSNNKLMIEQLEKILALERLMEESKNKHLSMFVDEVGHNKKLEIEKEELLKKLEDFQISVKALENSNASQNAMLQELGEEIAVKNAEIEKLNKMLAEQQKAHQEFIDGVQEMRCNLSKEEEHVVGGDESDYIVTELQEDMSESCDNVIFTDDDETGYAVVHQLDSDSQNVQIKHLVRLLAEKDEKIQVLNETIAKLISEVEQNASLKLQLEEMMEKYPALSAANSVTELQSDDRKPVEDCEFEKFAKFFSNIKMLNDEYTKANLCNESASKELAEALEKVNLLTEENQRFKKLLDQNELEIKHQSDEMVNVTSEKNNYLGTIDVLTAKLLTIEQELEAARDEVTSLSDKLKSQEDSELLQILKAQVDLYKSDYELEKAAHERAQHCADELTEKVRNLEKQLEDQSCTESRRHRKKGSSRRYSHEACAESEMESASTAVFSCPCCSLTFTALNALENHVRVCLDSQQ